jgi:FKBP-type peptidyl-prolyl cis-trans isomerase
MHNKKILFLKYLFISTLALLYGCDSSEEPAVDQELLDDKIISDYILTNNIIAEKDTSGIYCEKILENQIGKEQILDDNILTIHYTAKVLEGVGIDSTSTITGPDSVKVKQGVDAIFPVGLDYGLALMKKGEIFKFFIPSHLAFKDFSSSLPSIPANSILEITVELIEIENDAEQLAGEILQIENYITLRALNDTIRYPLLDSVELLPSGEYYKRISTGIQNDTLLIGAHLNLLYSGTFLNDTLNPFATGFLDYNFATGIVIQGLDSGVSQMERLENAFIIIPSQTAYKESAFYFPRSLGSDFVNELFIPNYATEVPPFSVLVFDVTLQ